MAKWTLTIEEEEGQTHRVELTRDVYRLGRDPSNDIVFRERNISRRHARLERAGPERWAIVDEGSRYGCFINGERVDGRGVISPADAILIGGYHLSVLSAGRRGGLSPALSVTRSLHVPVDVPPKLRLFDGLAPVADIRLDRGPVTLGSDSDCTVRLLGVEGALVHVRPLPGGSFEIVDRGDFVLVRLKGQELRRKILENADLFDLGDDLAVRFLQGGRHARKDAPDFSPSPLVDLSNGVAQGKVLGVEGVPVLRQGPQKAPAASTLVGLQAPRPPPLPSPASSSTPTDPVAWLPEQAETPTNPELLRPQMATERLQIDRLAADRFGMRGPGTEKLDIARLPPPPAAPDDPWAQSRPGPPPADMGWPMGPRAPSSAPGPGPDAWWFAGPPPPPPVPIAGVGVTQPLHAAHAPSPPPMRRGVVALVVLGPLTVGVLATALLVAKLRPSPPLPAKEDQPAVEPAESAVPSAPADASASASAAEGPAPPPVAAEGSAPPAAASEGATPPSSAAKPGRAVKPLSPEEERRRKVLCLQTGKCNLRRPKGE
ncbi:MAG TPA: FHA domain-containing protein [Polyangiaceae bacterium]|nr:FHA domain-containing protein [Polyangiaceae bacterium]